MPVAQRFRTSWLYLPKNGAAPDPFINVNGTLQDNPNDFSYIQQGLYYPYIRERKVYYCPLDYENDVDFVRRIQRVSSYIMNGAVCGFGDYVSDFQARGHKFRMSDFTPAAWMQWEPKVNKFGGYFAYNSGQDASQIPTTPRGLATDTSKAPAFWDLTRESNGYC